MGARDTRNQTANTAHERDPLARYFRDVRTHPLLSHTEVTALAQAAQPARRARKRLWRAGVSSAEAQRWRQQVRQGTMSYEQLAHELSEHPVVAVAKRYTIRYHMHHMTLAKTLDTVAHKVVSLAEEVDQGEGPVHQLVEGNLRLVLTMARRYLTLYGKYGLNRDDVLAEAIQEGNIGLLNAARGFNPARRTRFSTYAAPWIYRAIGAYLTHETLRGVHIPRERYERCQKVIKALELGLTRDALAQTTGLPEQQVQEAIDDLALLPQWMAGEAGLSVVDPQESPEAQRAAEEARTQLQEALDRLSRPERRLVEERTEGKSHSDIARAHCTTAGHIRVKLHRIRKELRRWLSSDVAF